MDKEFGNYLLSQPTFSVSHEFGNLITFALFCNATKVGHVPGLMGADCEWEFGCVCKALYLLKNFAV